MGNELSLDGRVAVVSGPGSIGREHALLLAVCGAHIVVHNVHGSLQGSHPWSYRYPRQSGVFKRRTTSSGHADGPR